MHKKRLYRALALVLSVSMLLPFPTVAHAAVEGSPPVIATTEDELTGSLSGAEGDTNEGSQAPEETGPPPVSSNPSEKPNNENPSEKPDGEPEDPMPTPSVTPEPTPSVTPEPTPSVTPEPTPSVTPEPTPSVTPEPTPSVTPEPTKAPTPEPTEAPKPPVEVIPTPEPTPEPTAVPTLEPTPEPTEAPVPELSEKPKKPKPTAAPIAEEEPAAAAAAAAVTPSPYNSNSDLVANQDIVMPSTMVGNFRFSTVDKVYAICNVKTMKVFEDSAKDSRVVGTMKKNGLCYILKEEENSNWIYIESGKVRGFVNKKNLITGKKAEEFVKQKKESKLKLAEPKVDPFQNEALTYTKTTVYETLVDKVYALAVKDQVNILEEMTEQGRIIGTLAKDGLCYILKDNLDGWLYVESANVRGFVKEEELYTGDVAEDMIAAAGEWSQDQEEQYTGAVEAYEAAALALEKNDADADKSEKKTEKLNVVYTKAKEARVEFEEKKQEALEKGEMTYQTAEEKILPTENKACYYTFTSVNQASSTGSIGLAMVEFAKQFVGNPYVWGGTSLTHGADCSGFVQQVYKHFGYSIPRTSREQAVYGTQIPVSEAQPGDLIFYANNGTVYHVIMYMGNGKAVNASSSKTGIIISGINYEKAVWATRIISENDQVQIPGNQAPTATSVTARSGQYGEFLGNFKLTAYCNCTKCCGKWSGGPTASGTTPTQGRTVAMAGVPFGTKLIIGGKIFTVEDRGTPYGHVDIYMNDHDECNQFGVQYAQTYLLK